MLLLFCCCISSSAWCDWTRLPFMPFRRCLCSLGLPRSSLPCCSFCKFDACQTGQVLAQGWLEGSGKDPADQAVVRAAWARSVWPNPTALCAWGGWPDPTAFHAWGGWPNPTAFRAWGGCDLVHLSASLQSHLAAGVGSGEETVGVSHFLEHQGGHPCLGSVCGTHGCLGMEGCGADCLGVAQE